MSVIQKLQENPRWPFAPEPMPGDAVLPAISSVWLPGNPPDVVQEAKGDAEERGYHWVTIAGHPVKIRDSDGQNETGQPGSETVPGVLHYDENWNQKKDLMGRLTNLVGTVALYDPKSGALMSNWYAGLDHTTMVTRSNMPPNTEDYLLHVTLAPDTEKPYKVLNMRGPDENTTDVWGARFARQLLDGGADKKMPVELVSYWSLDMGAGFDPSHPGRVSRKRMSLGELAEYTKESMREVVSPSDVGVVPEEELLSRIVSGYPENTRGSAEAQADEGHWVEIDGHPVKIVGGPTRKIHVWQSVAHVAGKTGKEDFIAVWDTKTDEVYAHHGPRKTVQPPMHADILAIAGAPPATQDRSLLVISVGARKGAPDAVGAVVLRGWEHLGKDDNERNLSKWAARWARAAIDNGADPNTSVRVAYLSGGSVGTMRRVAGYSKEAAAQEAYNPEQPRDPHGRWWHGSHDGTFGPNTPHAIHVGTHEAAKQALESRIGIPAKGEWDGTREYGKTLIAGQKTMKAKGIFPTGYNAGGPGKPIPNHDYLPTDPNAPERATYAQGKPVPLDAKPNIFPVKIVGSMNNSTDTPYEDFKANGYMSAALKRGNAKNGYFYKNISEDEGSISAVVPSPAHLQRLDKAKEAWDPERHPRGEHGHFSQSEKSFWDDWKSGTRSKDAHVRAAKWVQGNDDKVLDALHSHTQERLKDLPNNITLHRGFNGEEFYKAVDDARAQGKDYVEFKVSPIEGMTDDKQIATDFAKGRWQEDTKDKGIVISISVPKASVLAADRVLGRGLASEHEYAVIHGKDMIRVPLGSVEKTTGKYYDETESTKEATQFVEPVHWVTIAGHSFPIKGARGEMREVSAEEFVAERDKNKRLGYLSQSQPDELKGGYRFFLSADKKVGFGISPEGHGESLFNNGGEKGAGTKALFEGIKHGMITLDCFDGYLPSLYTQAGFVETGRIKFNDQYAPKDWDYKKDGRPDVVFMSFRGWPNGQQEQSRERAVSKENWLPYKPGAKYYNDYETAKSDARRAANPQYRGT